MIFFITEFVAFCFRDAAPSASKSIILRGCPPGREKFELQADILVEKQILESPMPEFESNLLPLSEGNATHSSILAREFHGWGAWWLQQSMGS